MADTEQPRELGCSKCRYARRGCQRCRQPGFAERARKRRKVASEAPKEDTKRPQLTDKISQPAAAPSNAQQTELDDNLCVLDRIEEQEASEPSSLHRPAPSLPGDTGGPAHSQEQTRTSPFFASALVAEPAAASQSKSAPAASSPQAQPSTRKHRFWDSGQQAAAAQHAQQPSALPAADPAGQPSGSPGPAKASQTPTREPLDTAHAAAAAQPVNMHTGAPPADSPCRSVPQQSPSPQPEARSAAAPRAVPSPEVQQHSAGASGLSAGSDRDSWRSDFASRLQESMLQRRHLRQQEATSPIVERKKPKEANRKPRKPKGLQASGDPRRATWEPPPSPFGLVEEVLYHDPWKLLLACMLLNKTSGRAVRKVLWDLFRLVPNAAAAAETDVAQIRDLIYPLGLATKRAPMLKRFCADYLHKQWTSPLELHGIGQYGADAYFMFCRGDWREVHPTDKDLLRYRNWLADTDGLGQGLERDKAPDFI